MTIEIEKSFSVSRSDASLPRYKQLKIVRNQLTTVRMAHARDQLTAKKMARF